MDEAPITSLLEPNWQRIRILEYTLHAFLSAVSEFPYFLSLRNILTRTDSLPHYRRHHPTTTREFLAAGLGRKGPGPAFLRCPWVIPYLSTKSSWDVP